MSKYPESIQRIYDGSDPVIQYFLDQNADNLSDDVLEQAKAWQVSQDSPDTEAHTLFGAVIDADVQLQIILGNLMSPQQQQQLGDSMRSQLADGVIDDDSGTFRATNEEMRDFCNGVLHCAATWRSEARPFPHIEKVSATVNGEWSSPFVPAFQISVVIDEESIGDPKSYRCSGVLGPDTGVIRLEADYDSLSGTLTLTAKSDANILITHNCDANLKKAIESGSLENTEWSGITKILTQKGVLHPAALQLTDGRDDDLAQVLNRAQRRYLTTDARKDKDKIRKELRALLDSEDNRGTHERQTNRLLLMDRLKLADENDPLLLDGVKDQYDPPNPIESMLSTMASNGDSCPSSGGVRALWLAKIGWLNSRKYDTEIANALKNRFLDEKQREFYQWMRSLLRQPNHPDNQDTGKWRRLEAKIDALTQLTRNATSEPAPDDEEPLPQAEEGWNDVPREALQVGAENELNDRVQQVLGDDAEIPEDVADDDGSDYIDDYQRLDQLLADHPEYFPKSIRPPPDADDEDARPISVVDETEAVDILQMLDHPQDTDVSRKIRKSKSKKKKKKSQSGAAMKLVGEREADDESVCSCPPVKP
jgi:hypothetical protein